MKARHYNRGVIRSTPYGTFRAEVNFRNRRYRRTFRRELHARAWIDETALTLENQDAPLGLYDAHDARQAMTILPDGVTLVEAARCYVGQRGQQDSPLVADALAAYVADKRMAGLRSASIDSIRQRVGAWTRAAGDMRVSDISPEVVTAWFRSRLDLGPGTRLGYRRDLHAFFAWAIRMGYVRANPVDAVSLPRTEHTPPGILSPEDATRLMVSAEAHISLCASLALGLFAGIRTAELMRLTWRDITDEHISITGAAAKTRQQRYATICNNLRAWLGTYRATGPVIPLKSWIWFRRLQWVAQSIGLQRPPNAMRHSFATYHLALYRDAGLTAHELGHSSPDMLYRYYRNLATQDQGRAYFDIMPSRKCPDKA